MPVKDITYDAGAAAYDRFTGRWSLAFRSTLLAAARVSVGQTVLDVAAGTGVLAEIAASQVGISGRVIATDISLPMLRVAQRKIAGLPVYAVVMDGQALACRDRSFDVVICQLGLMFFPDARRGLQEFRRVILGAMVVRWSGIVEPLISKSSVGSAIAMPLVLSLISSRPSSSATAGRLLCSAA